MSGTGRGFIGSTAAFDSMSVRPIEKMGVLVSYFTRDASRLAAYRSGVRCQKYSVTSRIPMYLLLAGKASGGVSHSASERRARRCEGKPGHGDGGLFFLIHDTVLEKIVCSLRQHRGHRSHCLAFNWKVRCSCSRRHGGKSDLADTPRNFSP
jgi:hypothetical protein